MPHYLHQIAYASEGWEALIAQPQDRIEAVRTAIEKLGGRSRVPGLPSASTTL
jgi:hypothetical protein